MEVTNFYVPNSSMRFKMIEDSERYHKTKVPKSKDEAKFQDSDVPIGIWSWAKSNQEYKQLISNLGINEIDNEQILMNLVEGDSNYQALEATNYRNDPDQKGSILFKESRAFEMYILKEVRGWTVKSIAAKYGIDGHSVLRWVREVRNEIKRKLAVSKWLHPTSKGKITNDHVEEVSSFLKEKIGWRLTVAWIQKHISEKSNLACISDTTLRKVLKKNLGLVFKKVDKI